MKSFEPGQRVRHIRTKEEAEVVRPLLWTIQNSRGEGLLVKVGNEERFWLAEEIELIKGLKA